ncbi:Glycosyltransferase involved in cell wall bisynthesis [Jatrophihabitans endophyticus]|uniref:Glycosyltransferase involved in cell wall bisynthesis n=1 Tax=Jatrophihabitans endophyticus TaxID=1206085 RepID=A0A1M5I303_9ACTN|nr:glycosyltransferase [Jatrophihabitans endophyticus]SHG22656.1 Glycosyltransferase involved in cell wall bisynthesis [Jatrophihabitans endophyticus]
MSRPRLTWIAESLRPNGALTMTRRRMHALRTVATSRLVVLSRDPATRAQDASPYRGVHALAGLSGEALVARADVVMTTSARSLASATARRHGGMRIVHFLHGNAMSALRNELFLRSIPAASRVVVPLSIDPVAFARDAGIAAHRVVACDDFVLPQDAPLATALAPVVLAVGQVTTDTTLVDVVEAFRLALPGLAGWQLRIVGAGGGTRLLTQAIEDAGLVGRAILLGARHDLPTHYLDAGLVVRTQPNDANGLSVLEALAAGVPVLGAATVPAVQRLVRHGETGWVLERNEPDAIAEALLAACDDPVRAGMAAAVRAQRPVSPVERDADIARLIAEVMAERPPAAEVHTR